MMIASTEIASMRTEARGSQPAPLARSRERGWGRGGRSAPPASKGFTLIELIVVIIIVVVIGGTFLNRMFYYQEQAEKAAMEGVVAAMQSALTLQYAQILTRGKPADVPALAYANPMDWLQKRPYNYAGEFYDPQPSSVEPGNWAFDLKSRELIYVPNNANYFSPGKDGKKWVRFHVVLDYRPPLAPSLQHEPASLSGALFVPVEPYSWF